MRLLSQELCGTRIGKGMGSDQGGTMQILQKQNAGRNPHLRRLCT